MKAISARLSTALGVFFCLMGSAEAAPCAQGDMTVTATFPNDAGFEDLWKYTISGSWDTGEGASGLSHISFLYSLSCPCICDEGFASFPVPAGTATGVDSTGNACTVEFLGLSECEGDPTIPDPEPAIKFEAPVGQGCETGAAGTGTWCFYSSLPPLPEATYPGVVVVKYGNESCSGDLTGQLPDCSSCDPISVEPETWGGIKVLYESSHGD